MEDIIIVSGILPDKSGGTASALQRLEYQAKENNLPIAVYGLCRDSIEWRPSEILKFFSKFKKFFNSASRSDSRCLKFKEVLKSKNLVLAHPQTLGYAEALMILSTRGFTWLLVLDSSFFCRASYNTYNHESQPCLRCIGDGLEYVDKFGCSHFPVRTQNHPYFQRDLQRLGRERKVGFLAQNLAQARLLREHFGTNAIVEIIGMTADYWGISKNPEPIVVKKQITFHGNPLAAKGVYWAIDLAEELVDFTFIFPFDKSAIRRKSFPANARFKDMNWDTGLREFVESSEFVLCPSIWSAPIEGALIKSLIHGQTCLVIENASSYVSEDQTIPVVTLPVDVGAAARMLREIDVTIRKESKGDWVKVFLQKSNNFASRLYNAVTQTDPRRKINVPLRYPV